MLIASRIFDLKALSIAPRISTWVYRWDRDGGTGVFFPRAIDVKSFIPVAYQLLVDLAISCESHHQLRYA
jgi:hypothetical protein